MRENCTSGSEGRAEVAAMRSAASPDPTPAMPSNKTGGPVAEAVEGRGSVEGNTASETRAGLRARVSASSDLERVRRVALKGRDTRLTALLHHVSVDRLRSSFRGVAPGCGGGGRRRDVARVRA